MGVVYDADGNTLVEATLMNDLYIFDIRDTMQYQKVMLASSAPKEDLNYGMGVLITATSAIAWLL